MLSLIGNCPQSKTASFPRPPPWLGQPTPFFLSGLMLKATRDHQHFSSASSSASPCISHPHRCPSLEHSPIHHICANFNLSICFPGNPPSCITILIKSENGNISYSLPIGTLSWVRSIALLPQPHVSHCIHEDTIGSCSPFCHSLPQIQV